MISISNVSAAAAEDLKFDPTSRMDRAMSAYTPLGRMLFSTREVLVDGTYPSGRPVRGNLYVLFDGSTGHFYGYLPSSGLPLTSFGNLGEYLHTSIV
jgi:hypothetical protein